MLVCMHKRYFSYVHVQGYVTKQPLFYYFRRKQIGSAWFLNSFCFTFAIIYFQIALQGNVPFSYFTPPFLINEPSLQ